MARIDAILKERYDNHLPMTPVRYFYDHLETSMWESGEPGPVQEIAVGLEARSVDGNRRAC